LSHVPMPSGGKTRKTSKRLQEQVSACLISLRSLTLGERRLKTLFRGCRLPCGYTTYFYTCVYGRFLQPARMDTVGVAPTLWLAYHSIRRMPRQWQTEASKGKTKEVL